MNDKLRELATKIMEGGEIDVEDLINQFSPTINKYSYELGYEDAKQELVLKLIEIKNDLRINKGDKPEGRLVNYMNRIIRNEYIKLNKKNQKIRNLEIEFDESYSESYNVDYLSEINFNEIISVLQGKNREVMVDIFVNQISEVEIAEKLGMTRQGISNIKNRSLNKLRNHFNHGCKMFVG